VSTTSSSASASTPTSARPTSRSPHCSRTAPTPPAPLPTPWVPTPSALPTPASPSRPSAPGAWTTADYLRTLESLLALTSPTEILAAFPSASFTWGLRSNQVDRVHLHLVERLAGFPRAHLLDLHLSVAGEPYPEPDAYLETSTLLWTHPSLERAALVAALGTTSEPSITRASSSLAFAFAPTSAAAPAAAAALRCPELSPAALEVLVRLLADSMDLPTALRAAEALTE
jgi:hypothetical protein